MKSNKAKTRVVGAALAALLIMPVAMAEGIDGADILDKEEKRSKELSDIEYQTMLLEKKARLARMYQELQAHGGFVPDLEFMRKQEQKGPEPVERNSAASRTTSSELPELKRIEGRKAYFHTQRGMVVARVGSPLPGGYTVTAIDMENGVELEKGGITYQTDVAWQ